MLEENGRMRRGLRKTEGRRYADVRLKRPWCSASLDDGAALRREHREVPTVVLESVTRVADGTCPFTSATPSR